MENYPRAIAAFAGLTVAIPLLLAALFGLEYLLFLWLF
jgi:hypothetical protein